MVNVPPCKKKYLYSKGREEGAVGCKTRRSEHSARMRMLWPASTPRHPWVAPLGWVFLATRGAMGGVLRLGGTPPYPLPGELRRPPPPPPKKCVLVCPYASSPGLPTRQNTPAFDAAIYYPNSTSYQLQPSFHTHSTEPEPTARARRAGKEFY